MTSFLKNILKFLFNYRPIALGVCMLLCALMVSTAFNLKLKEDILDLLPLEDESVSSYADVLRAFQMSDRLIFMVQGKSNDTSKEILIAAADKLADELRNSKLIKQVYYKWSAWEANEALNVLHTFRADLFDQEDEQRLKAVLNQQVRELIRTAVQLFERQVRSHVGQAQLVRELLERLRDQVHIGGFVFMGLQILDSLVPVLFPKPFAVGRQD